MRLAQGTTVLLASHGGDGAARPPRDSAEPLEFPVALDYPGCPECQLCLRLTGALGPGQGVQWGGPGTLPSPCEFPSEA